MVIAYRDGLSVSLCVFVRRFENIGATLQEGR
jgi:hypothetical protein